MRSASPSTCKLAGRARAEAGEMRAGRAWVEDRRARATAGEPERSAAAVRQAARCRSPSGSSPAPQRVSAGECGAKRGRTESPTRRRGRPARLAPLLHQFAERARPCPPSLSCRPAKQPRGGRHRLPLVLLRPHQSDLATPLTPPQGPRPRAQQLRIAPQRTTEFTAGRHAHRAASHSAHRLDPLLPPPFPASRPSHLAGGQIRVQAGRPGES